MTRLFAELLKHYRGRVEGWKGGRVEGWKGGRVEEGKGGRIEGRSQRSLFTGLEFGVRGS
jgi:hypothetical protein